MNSTSTTTRNVLLDFVKGVLVVVMVIYHVMNIFSTASAEAYGYIRFVSGSFIFLSGYIISTFYQHKFQVDGFGTSKRLVSRGLKILLVFSVLNILIHVTGIGNPNKAQIGLHQYVNYIAVIYGYGDTRYASFQILLPIAYVLMISPLFLLCSRVGMMLALSSLIAAYCFSISGIQSVNLGFAIIGVIGICVGMIIGALRFSFSIKNVLLIFGCFITCIYLMEYLDRNLLAYSMGIMLIVKMLYDLGGRIRPENAFSNMTILFGKYSLICYITQIVFLQVLFRVLSRVKLDMGFEIISIVVVTNIFLLLLCLCLNFFRGQCRLIDRSYRFVFS